MSGFGRAFVEAVKAQPDTCFTGRFTTLEAFESWVLSHPEFRSSHHWAARKKELEELRKLKAKDNGVYVRGKKLSAEAVRQKITGTEPSDFKISDSTNSTTK